MNTWHLANMLFLKIVGPSKSVTELEKWVKSNEISGLPHNLSSGLDSLRLSDVSKQPHSPGAKNSTILAKMDYTLKRQAKTNLPPLGCFL